MWMFKRKVDAHEQLDYYHGLIDRSDCTLLLVENGDFLLRLREEYGSRKLTISCMHDKTLNGENKIRHFDIQKSKNEKFFLDSSNSFGSVAKLIDEYVKNKLPVQNSDYNYKKPIFLITPINRQAWELDENDITKKKKIGQGEFGEVMAGTLLLKTHKKVDVAIKIAKPGTDQKKVTEFFTEARLMRSFDHPNVVKFYGVVYEPIMLVMELVPDGSLDHYLKKYRGSVTEEEKLDHMVMGAAWGLEYLHSKNCIHRDIACRNCLYSKEAVKISDFGLTIRGVFYTLKQEYNLPVKWLAPETLEYGQYFPKSDVFSFGIMIWEIFANGNEPYLGMTNEQVQKAVAGGFRLEFDDAPETLVDLVANKMWTSNIEARLSMSEVCRNLESMTSEERRIPPANKKIIEEAKKLPEFTQEETVEIDVAKASNNAKSLRSKKSKQKVITFNQVLHKFSKNKHIDKSRRQKSIDAVSHEASKDTAEPDNFNKGNKFKKQKKKTAVKRQKAVFSPKKITPPAVGGIPRQSNSRSAMAK